MDASQTVRQRNPKTSEDVVASAPTPAARARTEDRAGISLIDIFRTLTLLFLTSSVLSWFITKDGIWWGHRPGATRLVFWQDLLRGEVLLTLEELKNYDGSDPSTPIYLAINGTIFDVTAGRKFYGPDGSYSYFSGADATRGFVTGCFAEDITPDMRGVELMYIPKDDPEIDKLYGSGRLKSQKEQERRMARKKVEEGVKHWVEFFGNSKKYRRVGRVKRDADWEAKLGPVRKLCDRAEEGRPTREAPPKDG